MKKLIIANWKMNGSKKLFDEFVQEIAHEQLILAVPCVLVGHSLSADKKFAIAAQDCSVFNGYGAKTGEVSAQMLFDFGVRYVILGHSERRVHMFDSIEHIYQKMQNCINSNLKIIFCVDENYQNLIDEKTNALLLANQNDIIIAYEPVSAIGTGVLPTLIEIEGALASIKNQYPDIKTIYGGSVNSANIQSILSIEKTDGVLIGGAGLKIDEMRYVLNSVDAQ